jgi:hypothetical protein
VPRAAHATSLPLEAGAARCDGTWRIRLQANYAKFLLTKAERGKKVSLFVATLDRESVFVWGRNDFVVWRDHLNRNVDANSELLDALEYFGGESESDQHGRFIVPKNVRDGLTGFGTDADLKILSQYPLKLISSVRYEAEKSSVDLGPELAQRARGEFSRFIGMRSSRASDR